MSKIKRFSDIYIDFFTDTGSGCTDSLFECICTGIHGGINRYNVEPNNGIFDKDFLIKFVKINQGDNDFDYELGRLGYQFLTSDEGLKELAKFYLHEISSHYKNEYLSDTVLKNTTKSLVSIIES